MTFTYGLGGEQESSCLVADATHCECDLNCRLTINGEKKQTARIDSINKEKSKREDEMCWLEEREKKIVRDGGGFPGSFYLLSKWQIRRARSPK